MNRKIFTLLFSVGLLLTACGPAKGLLANGGKPLSLRMAESEMLRNPSPTTLDGIAPGKVKWNYTTGLELLSLMDAAKAYDRPDLYDYALKYYDTIVQADGSVLTYAKEKYNLDHICPGRPLFEIYERTGEERYLAVLDTLYAQLQGQPRTADGGFWHKQVYPNQMWLDGLYMAEPFYAEYVHRFVATRDIASAAEREADIARQFLTVARYTYDPETELYRHACDASREMFWCDKTTGQTPHAWGRAMGWYAMAIVETLDYLSPSEGRDAMVGILNRIYEVLPRYADPEAGMWYQVLDEPGREGNYLEATGSIMFVYARLKAIRKGWLPESGLAAALADYERFVKRFVKENEDGTISITDCCAVAGLGGKSMRDGTFEYYISEPVIENDCKGVGPFIWASLEYEKATGILPENRY